MPKRISESPRSASKGERNSSRLPGTKADPPPTPAPLESVEPQAPNGSAFPVVGFGASAGGLEAITQLLAHLPADTGMAFVFVQHLDPKRESLLAEILSRVTTMRVLEVKRPTILEPGGLYVAPPAVDIRMEKRVLYPVPYSATGHPHMAIDYFFRSLAQDLGNKAIGVILSGTGSDGSLGLKAVKAEGGITFAQDEKSAKHDGMPVSAVAAGCVDFVMPPDRIAGELAQLGNHPYIAPSSQGPPEEVVPVPDDMLAQILHVIHGVTGVDLSQYKPNTIKRRILRRVLVNKLESLDLYLKRLQTEPVEVRALYEDLLISVTQFFRDPETFQVLSADIFPKIAGEGATGPVRFWVPGCSTGEEVYSLAICLLEYLEDRAQELPFQIFGTDISERALDKARAGLYSENVAADISPERLKRFFARVEGGYQIGKRIREACIFARQNLTKDPPFSRLDLISCRNVLIYLGHALQKKSFRSFITR